MAYKPSLKDLKGLIPKEEDYNTSLKGLYDDHISKLNNNQQYSNNFNPGFFEKLSPNILVGLSELGKSIINAPSNISHFAAQQGVINPSIANSIPRMPDYNYSEMLRLPGTTSDQIVQSLVKNAPAMVMPGLRGTSFIPSAASRILGQAGWGALTNQNPLQGAKEFGEMQAALETIPIIGKPIAVAAEAINPIKYAGSIAEKIRNLAQTGYKEGEKYYKPVHEKYDDSWVTVEPNKYLGFHPEDTQYFKPSVNRANRDFLAEPTFKNLHQLQSEMGKYPELAPMRDSVKQKIQGFLGQDEKMLTSYNKGSNILREKYYPYTSNDTLLKITEHEKPIEKFNTNELSKALSNSPLVQESSRSNIPIKHPLVDLNNKLQNKMNYAKVYQYGIPSVIGGVGGHFIEPGLGSIGGSMIGSVFGKYGEPQLLQLAQNPALLNALSKFNLIVQGAGRQAAGYSMYNE